MEKYIPRELLNRYEFGNYGHAVEILTEAFPGSGERLSNASISFPYLLRILRLRVETNHRFPRNLIRYCILMAGVKLESAGILL